MTVKALKMKKSCLRCALLIESRVLSKVAVLGLMQDDDGGDAEEAVSVEWAEKCLSIHFKCPCGKGYQILLSGNNCYYKLV